MGVGCAQPAWGLQHPLLCLADWFPGQAVTGLLAGFQETGQPLVLLTAYSRRNFRSGPPGRSRMVVPQTLFSPESNPSMLPLADPPPQRGVYEPFLLFACVDCGACSWSAVCGYDTGVGSTLVGAESSGRLAENRARLGYSRFPPALICHHCWRWQCPRPVTRISLTSPLRLCHAPGLTKLQQPQC